MAPGRKRRVGSTRMHAAVDAMRPYGFSPDIVRKSVKSLLKVYGEENWFFIEDNSYKELLENILEGAGDDTQLEVAAERPELGCGGGSQELRKSVPELCDKEGICEEEVGRSNVHEPRAFDEDMDISDEENQGKRVGDRRGTCSALKEKDHWACIEESVHKLLKEAETILEEPGVHAGEHPLMVVDEEPQCVPLLSDKDLANDDEAQASDLGDQKMVVQATPVKLENLSDEAQAGSQLHFVSAELIDINQAGPKPCYGWISDEDDECK